MGAMGKVFIRYVSFSILGMLGSAGTILADTMFVSNKLGAEGLAALNIAISVFGLVMVWACCLAWAAPHAMRC